MPPMPDDRDAPPAPEEETKKPVAEPASFWNDVSMAVKRELKPPVMGFFTPSPNPPVKGYLRDGKLILACTNSFITEQVNKPEVLQVVARKTAAVLGKPITVVAVDQSAAKENSDQIRRLLQFGRDHADVIHIKEND